MGTITPRKRKDGSIRHTAQIRLKQGGRVVFTEARTFDREQAASARLKKRELELAQPGALESAKVEDPLLKEAIGQYVKDSKRKLGRTKEQVLRTIQEAPIGSMRCSEVGSPEIVQFAQSLDVLPQTAGNYISHLATVFAIARPASGYPLNQQAMSDARKAMKRLGTTSKSAQRDRRPTLDALDKIFKYYVEMETRERAEIPMPRTIAFALFSTRRQEQITTIAREDYQQDQVMVRDMKHLGQKSGNDTWCDLPLEAARARFDARQDRGVLSAPSPIHQRELYQSLQIPRN
ncbi:site-specific integrase [Paraburkholderia sp.]|uniref:site-specific integrase n=1 Tax=Paraburkholderia sp. TaxID=1926495 RepID=UPI003D6FB076